MLRRDGNAISKQRKSKARTKAMEENENKLSEIMRQQRQVYSNWQNHIGKGRDSELGKEVRRRNEVGEREHSGDLLPDEEETLNKLIGAKPFDPKASEEHFYRHNGNKGYDKKAVSAIPVDLGYDQEGFVTRSQDGDIIGVYHGKTGHNLVEAWFDGNTSRNSKQAPPEERLRRAVNQAKHRVKLIVEGDENRKGNGKEALLNQVSSAVTSQGLSPRYELTGEVKRGKGVQVEKAPKKEVTPYHIINMDFQTKKSEYQPVHGAKKVDIGEGVHAFTHGSNGEWRVTEARSGMMLAQAFSDTRMGLKGQEEKVKALAIQNAKDILNRIGVDKLNESINKHIEKHGESPKTKK